MDSLQASSAHQPKVTPPSWEIEIKPIDLEKFVEEEMTKKAQDNHWRTEPCSIFRVPTFLRWSSFRTYNPKKINVGPYDPKFVSIGPYHHGNPRLQPMEEFKWRALRFLLSDNTKTTLHQCLAKMKDLEPRARSCYSETFKNISNDDFAKMMLLDGCLVLVILKENMENIALLSGEQRPPGSFIPPNNNDGAIAPAWPIFKSLVADLLLLENQVPFFVLDELFMLLRSAVDEETMVKMALKTLIRVYPGTKYFFDDLKPSKKIHHLLHLFYLAIALPLVPGESTVPAPEVSMLNFKKMMINPMMTMFKKMMSKPMMTKFKEMMSKLWHWRLGANRGGRLAKGIPSVTELKEAGVKFRPKKNAKSFLDVTFQNGVMEIPSLILYPYTQTTLRNIIAFEQSFGEQGELTHISHYVIMMAFLIGGSTDISTLQDEEIIINWLGSQEEVLGVFKQLRSEVIDNARDKFTELYNQINKYRRLRLNRYREILRRDYFGKGSIVSVIAAVVLFVLTFMQTYFAVYTTYHPNS